jgi:hypothetical protein
MDSARRGVLVALVSLWLSRCAILALDPPPDNIPRGPNSFWVVAPIVPETETFTVRFGADLVPGTFAAQHGPPSGGPMRSACCGGAWFGELL